MGFFLSLEVRTQKILCGICHIRVKNTSCKLLFKTYTIPHMYVREIVLHREVCTM